MDSFTMPGITPVNSRESLPKGMQYPLRYADIEAAMKPFIDHNVFIDAGFSRCAYLVARTEENLSRDAYNLLYFHYDPAVPEWKSDPWTEVDDPLVVTAYVSAIPTWLDKKVTPRRPMLRKLLCDHIPRLMAECLREQPFKLYLTLQLSPPRIQVDIQVGMIAEAGPFYRTSEEHLLEELKQSNEIE